MVFKRRDKLTPLRWLARWFWPQGGWSRAAKYLHLRLHRLPDTPHKIARGVFAGVFTVFSPFYGLHFIVAFLIAKLLRGNVIAALVATFVGNPLTYVPIGIVSLKMGHFMLGTEFDHANERSFVGKSYDALRELWGNILSIVSGKEAEWAGIYRFLQEIFLPYLVGGILPGLVAGLAAYYVTLPMVAAFQLRRRKKLKAKLDELRRNRQAAQDPESS